MTLAPDTRQGLTEEISMQLSYEAQQNLGKKNGLDRVAFFRSVPYVVVRTTYKVYGTEGDWKNKMNEMEASYNSFANGNTNVHLESVSPGDKFFMDGGEYFGGSYTIANYNRAPMGVPDRYAYMEYKSYNVPVGGWYEGSAMLGKLYYTQPAYGPTTAISFTGANNTLNVGDGHAGGMISSVNQSNPRYVGDTLVFDYSLQAVDLKGEAVPF